MPNDIAQFLSLNCARPTGKATSLPQNAPIPPDTGVQPQSEAAVFLINSDQVALANSIDRI